MAGEAIGSSHTPINRWENGIDEPQIGALIELSNLYGVSTDWLLTGQGPGIEASRVPAEQDPLPTQDDYVSPYEESLNDFLSWARQQAKENPHFEGWLGYELSMLRQRADRDQALEAEESVPYTGERPYLSIVQADETRRVAEDHFIYESPEEGIVMDENLFNEIRATLPNFPDEILREWLLPFAKTEGWPPADGPYEMPKGRWKYLLTRRALAYWSNLQWQKVQSHISANALTPRSLQIIVSLAMGAICGEVNIYTMQITNLKERFFQVIDHLKEYGTLPKPPVLVKRPSGFDIIDGNHRLAAYYYAYGYLDIPGIEGGVLLNAAEEQDFWIGQETTQ